MLKACVSKAPLSITTNATCSNTPEQSNCLRRFQTCRNPVATATAHNPKVHGATYTHSRAAAVHE